MCKQAFPWYPEPLSSQLHYFTNDLTSCPLITVVHTSILPTMDIFRSCLLGTVGGRCG
ncbi:hypothetical protein COCON_G00077990 [Conger conger]|uniref:Uncharacterized protein n=1 Tax=Conger conger TaxID=82655 RepID=A0A9Q1DP21_CONCO|nr:hypothetical protein COCON_G00077990 [Conger conger]